MDSYGSELPTSCPVVTTDAFPVAYKSLHNSRKPSRLAPVHSMKSMYCSLSVCSILMALLGMSYLLFDPIVKYVILNRLVLRNDSDFAALWQNPPITPHFKVYFFNFTNPKEFFDGTEAPRVKEVGPFTYHQKWIKENVRWHDDGTMSYSTRKEFKFIPEESVYDQSKINLTLINVPVISAMHQLRHLGYFQRMGVEWGLSSIGSKIWTSKTPEEFVWGYPETLFDLAKAFLPDAPPLDNFGFFTKKNQSKDLPSYTMYTGEGNPYNLSKISLFNGKHSLGVWGNETCDKVQGSDGATFNPYIQEEETLWFFNDQLCRSMPLVFDKSVKSGGLPGYRFVPRQDVFKMDFDKYPQNRCFCQGEDLCSLIGDGMFAVPKCQFDAPIVLSWPHFLHANQTFANMVSGVTPADPEKHGFWFDIQPTTGTTLSAKARIQINVAVQNNGFTQVSKINDTIMPLLWFEEGLDELGDDLKEVIGQAVTEPPKFKQYILFMLLGMSMATLCVIFITFICFCMNKRAERVNRGASETIRDMMVAQASLSVQGKTQVANFKRGHAHNPSQGSGKFLLESEDSSRHHSRNSSTGSTPPTFVTSEVVVSETPKFPEEADRLLNPDQRSE